MKGLRFLRNKAFQNDGENLTSQKSKKKDIFFADLIITASEPERSFSTFFQISKRNLAT